MSRREAPLPFSFLFQGEKRFQNLIHEYDTSGLIALTSVSVDDKCFDEKGRSVGRMASNIRLYPLYSKALLYSFHLVHETTDGKELARYDNHVITDLNIGRSVLLSTAQEIMSRGRIPDSTAASLEEKAIIPLFDCSPLISSVRYFEHDCRNADFLNYIGDRHFLGTFDFACDDFILYGADQVFDKKDENGLLVTTACRFTDFASSICDPDQAKQVLKLARAFRRTANESKGRA